MTYKDKTKIAPKVIKKVLQKYVNIIENEVNGLKIEKLINRRKE